MSDCPRFGKWIGGCKFEPRYNLTPANISQFQELRGNAAPMLETLRSKTYVHDVCVRCGKVIATDSVA